MRRTENKIKELQQYLKTLRMKEKQLCDEEILKAIREIAGKEGDPMKLIEKLREESEKSKRHEEVKSNEKQNNY